MKCWNCGKNTMQEAPEIGQDWYQCTSCGATHEENPTTGSGGTLMSVESNPQGGYSKYKPGAGVASKAARIREALKKAMEGKK